MFKRKKNAPDISVNIIQNIVIAYQNSLQGKESLHATVLERNGKAIALCGASGAGKSTLAACLLASDPTWKLVTDDVAYVAAAKGGAFIKRTSSSYLKFGKRTMMHFQTTMRPEKNHIRDLKNIEYDPNLQKEILFLENTLSARNRRRLKPKISEEIPITGFYQLCRKRRQTRAELERIKGAKAPLFLLANIYNELLRPPEVMRRQFHYCSRLAQCVPVCRLNYADGFSRMQEAVRLVSASVRRQLNGYTHT